MSIPENSTCRGCASNFATPVTEQDTRVAQNLVNMVQSINCNPSLPQIRYRIGTHDSDVTRHVVRWDSRPPETIMENGFRAWPQGNTPDITYYDLYAAVENSGQPLDQQRNSRHVFISTTVDLGWRPNLSMRTLPAGRSMQIYRYEIYAPGGIWVGLTLADQYTYNSQLEVSFVAGIVPQYIRSVQLFTVTRPGRSRYVRYRRANNVLILNARFNPMYDPAMHLFIYMPIHYFQDENDRTHRFLAHRTYTPTYGPRNRRQRTQVLNDVWAAALQWYGTDVANTPSYIDAAFCSYYTNEAYIFTKNEYVLLNYAPHSTGDRILNGPLHICDGFPSLIGTIFQEYGIDCAFDTDDGGAKAYIFCTNFCAYIDYAPRTTDDEIISGPRIISDMFPILQATVFEGGIDAAFSSPMSGEAYLFRGNQYGVINYTSKRVLYIQEISDGFPFLRGTVFESGIDAAFASHESNEAYIFKGKDYALLKFYPHEDGDYLIDNRVKPIRPNWPSLRRILPHKNGDLYTHHYQQPRRRHEHDEL